MMERGWERRSWRKQRRAWRCELHLCQGSVHITWRHELVKSKTNGSTTTLKAPAPISYRRVIVVTQI